MLHQNHVYGGFFQIRSHFITYELDDENLVLILCVQAFTVFMANEIILFNAPELRDWLETKDDITEDILDTLETDRVNGRTLFELIENDIKEIFPVLGDRKAVQRVVDSLKPQPKVGQVSLFDKV